MFLFAFVSPLWWLWLSTDTSGRKEVRWLWQVPVDVFNWVYCWSIHISNSCLMIQDFYWSQNANNNYYNLFLPDVLMGSIPPNKIILPPNTGSTENSSGLSYCNATQTYSSKLSNKVGLLLSFLFHNYHRKSKVWIKIKELTLSCGYVRFI